MKDIFNNEYYIIDCEDFTFFARKVHIIGFEAECSTNEVIQYIINIEETFPFKRNKRMYLEELTRFKTFEEAQAKAKEYNDKPVNKKMREDYINNMQRFLEMKYIVGDE